MHGIELQRWPLLTRPLSPQASYGVAALLLAAYGVLLVFFTAQGDLLEREAVPIMTGLLALIGGLAAYLAGSGKRYARELSAQQARRANGGAAWEWEHNWRAGASDRTQRLWRRMILPLAGGGLLVGSLHWTLRTQDVHPVVEWSIATALWLCFAVAVYVVSRDAQRALPHSGIRLEAERVPLLPGDRVTLKLTGISGDVERALHGTLRCVSETIEARGADRSAQRAAAYELMKLEADGVPSAGVVELDFELPRDAPGTDLTRNPPQYWDLELGSDGARHRSHFLVPVYAPAPSASSIKTAANES